MKRIKRESVKRVLAAMMCLGLLLATSTTALAAPYVQKRQSVQDVDHTIRVMDGMKILHGTLCL